MGFRLTNKIPSQTRDIDEPKTPKPKLFFVVEGSETEGLYIQEFKNTFVDKILGEIVFLDRVDGTKSHQLIVVKSIDTYFKLTANLDEKVIHQIGIIKEEILTESEISIEKLQEKLDLIKEIIGNENYQILFGNLPLVNAKPLEMINAIVELKGFERGFDKVLIIIDRDKQSFKDYQYDEVLNIAEKNGYNLGISNPCFELFLLLHLNNINQLDRDAIFENKRVRPRSKVKYISNALDVEMKKVSRRYNSKSNYDAKYIISQFSNLEKNIIESNLAINPTELKDSIGTSIYEIIKPYL